MGDRGGSAMAYFSSLSCLACSVVLWRFNNMSSEFLPRVFSMNVCLVASAWPACCFMVACAGGHWAMRICRRQERNRNLGWDEAVCNERLARAQKILPQNLTP